MRETVLDLGSTSEDEDEDDDDDDDDDDDEDEDEDEDDKKKCGEIITDGSSVISICEEGGRIVHKTYWRDLSK